MAIRAPRMSDGESQAWLALIAVAELLPVALDAQLREDSNITNVEFRVMNVLMQAPGSTVRMGELARLLSSNLPRLSKVISRMEERDFVTRVAVPDDRRAVDVVLTQAGRKALVHALPAHLDYVRTTVLNHLSAEDIEVLGRALEPLAQRLDRSGRYGCDSDQQAAG